MAEDLHFPHIQGKTAAYTKDFGQKTDYMSVLAINQLQKTLANNVIRRDKQKIPPFMFKC